MVGRLAEKQETRSWSGPTGHEALNAPAPSCWWYMRGLRPLLQYGQGHPRSPSSEFRPALRTFGRCFSPQPSLVPPRYSPAVEQGSLPLHLTAPVSVVPADIVLAGQSSSCSPFPNSLLAAALCRVTVG